jgi:hypothetical protein
MEYAHALDTFGWLSIWTSRTHRLSHRDRHSAGETKQQVNCRKEVGLEESEELTPADGGGPLPSWGEGLKYPTRGLDRVKSDFCTPSIDDKLMMKPGAQRSESLQGSRLVVSKRNDGMRIQLELSENMVAQIKEIMKDANIKTYSELFSNSLSVLIWLAKEARKGRVISSVDKGQGEVKTELASPLLDALSSAPVRDAAGEPVASGAKTRTT